jgi:biopolymer transport protein ExbB
VNKRKFKEAFELTKNDTSFVGRVLNAGMGRLQYGIEDARETAYNAVESVKASKEQLLNYMATIGTLGPMIGLVGTVYGMIKTFMVLGTGKADPKALAVGISEALSITLVGIGLAVPAIFGHAFFRNRLVKISNEAASISDDLLTQMYHFSRKPAPPEPRPAAAAVATAAPSANAEARGATAAIKPAP